MNEKRRIIADGDEVCGGAEEFSLEDAAALLEQSIPTMTPEQIDFYRDFENRVVWIDSEITFKIIDVVKYIMRCNSEDAEAGIDVKDRKPIKIMINSEGGDLMPTWSLINAIRISKTPVITINVCMAYSAAGYILAAGHKRLAMPGSYVLVHTGSRACMGDAEKFESANNHLKGMCEKINKWFFENTNITRKKYKKMAPFDWYMDEEQAIKYGIIDEVIKDLDEVDV